MDIPSDWKSFHLKDVTYESRVRAANENTTHLVVFGVNNQTGLSTDSKYHADTLDRYKIVKPGMFAYNPMRLNIGSIGYCQDTLGEGLVSPDYVVFGCKENELDSKYFSYCIQEHHWKNWVRRAGAGSVRVRIYYKDISIYPIILPPLAEQRKIADILSTWDEAIAKTEQLITALQRRKKGIMQRLLSGEVRFAGFDDKWQEVELQDIAKIIMGQSPGSSAYNVLGIGLPLIQGNADISNRKTAPKVFTSEITKQCEVDDIILSVRAPVGETALSIHAGCIGRGVCAIRATKCDSRFLYHLLVSREQRWQKFAQGSTFTAINSTDIRKFTLRIPKKTEEQSQIAKLFDVCDNEIDLHTTKLNAQKLQKKGLFQRLLIGQVRVRV